MTSMGAVSSRRMPSSVSVIALVVRSTGPMPAALVSSTKS